jgi:universal stress protein E
MISPTAKPGHAPMRRRRVLFAIRNPEAPKQPGLAKAIQVARALDASLELFHAITDPVFIELTRFGDASADATRERVEGEVRIHLLRHCAMVRKHGLEASSAVVWDYPPHEAVVRRAQSIGADLIVAECHRGARTRPWMIHLTDWELLRTSPVPVLLLRGSRPYRRPLVLAAVDPAHAHAKPTKLDDRVFAAASEINDGLNGQLHILHANYPSIVGISPPVLRTWSILTFEQLKEQERQAFEDFRAHINVPRKRAHLVDGNPATEIPRFAKQMGADIVVMGALSRSGLERVFIGNTAERILGALDCDVLVVKPESFASGVARTPRGMRVQAPTSMVS